MDRTVTHIRQDFLAFFDGAEHEIVPSSGLVPQDDPTLLFTNAGMVPFKNVFTGLDRRPYVRAASSQKCVRAGGKHNDLDNVGYTARHHTFFEMLGNFSFGDYFKERAISLAWRLLTDVWDLPKNRLLVTVYHDDDEARSLWRKIGGLSDDRIISIASSDNFWSMGDTGPCGPCSEIFYDHGDGIPGGPPGSPDGDGDRFIEIWNLVFMQYEQVAGKDGAIDRVPLPRPSIDTGMGLERIAAVLQGVHDNYDIDLFRRLIDASVDLTGVPADGSHRASHRVIADHLRSCSFLMADGVMPSNEGRGYVLRRIMRRAMRHAYLLGAKDPLMHRLLPALMGEMGAAYPELNRAAVMMADTFRGEEERFRETLGRGLKLLDDAMDRLTSGGQLAGDVAFKLYDTFGFPVDLTADILKGLGLGLDMDGFDAAMDRQRATARASWTGSGDVSADGVWFNLSQAVAATTFLGYDTLTSASTVRALVVDGESVPTAHVGDRVQVILDQTPFYGESGGQMGDIGTIATGDGAHVQVTNTKKVLGLFHVHEGIVTAGTLSVGAAAHAAVSGDYRMGLRHHHSATHLLHAVLRGLFGAGVVQKGSLVAHDRLRFDFSHGRPLTTADVASVERQVNELIRQNTPVHTTVMDPEKAIECGAMALFGEKYGSSVRVVSMGRGRDEDQDAPYSLELCGGTHVTRTGDMGFMKIVSESGVSAGVRRIEAVVGAAAEAYIQDRLAILTGAADLLKTRPDDLSVRIQGLLDDKKRLDRAVKDLSLNRAPSGGGVGSMAPVQVGSVFFLGQVVAGVSPQDLKSMADQYKKSLGSGVVALALQDGDKGSIVVAVTDDLTHHMNAVALVRVGAMVLGGKGGGGRPDMAQAGGPHGAMVKAALDAIQQALGTML